MLSCVRTTAFSSVNSGSFTIVPTGSSPSISNFGFNAFNSSSFFAVISALAKPSNSLDRMKNFDIAIGYLTSKPLIE